jgi:hypothetical protein
MLVLRRWVSSHDGGLFPCQAMPSPMSGHAIHIKIDGRTYAGTYQVDRKILTVTTPYGRKSAEIAPRVAHDILAHQLLQELVQEEKSRKGSTL